MPYILLSSARVIVWNARGPPAKLTPVIPPVTHELALMWKVSMDCGTLPNLCEPPVIMTVPLGSKVAVWLKRGWSSGSGSVSVQTLVRGL